MIYCVHSEHGVHLVQMSPLNGGIENEDAEADKRGARVSAQVAKRDLETGHRRRKSGDHESEAFLPFTVRRPLGKKLLLRQKPSSWLLISEGGKNKKPGR